MADTFDITDELDDIFGSKYFKTLENADSITVEYFNETKRFDIAIEKYNSINNIIPLLYLNKITNNDSLSLNKLYTVSNEIIDNAKIAGKS